MKRQFGQFLILVGSVVMVLFVLSYLANQINFWLFLGGAVLLFFGIRFVMRNPGQAPAKAERFRLIKKVSQRKKKDKEKKLSKKEKDQDENEETNA